MYNYHYQFKFIAIGDSKVGKSSIVSQFVSNSSSKSKFAEFGEKNLQIKRRNINFRIWDTSGQQLFKSMTKKHYYRTAIGVLLVYDVTQRKTFDNIQEWLDEVKEYGNKYFQIILVGNKNDLDAEREVTYHEGEKFAHERKLKFVQLNCKDEKKVRQVFEMVGEQIIEKIEMGRIGLNEKNGILVGEPDIYLNTQRNSGKVIQERRRSFLCF